MGGCLKFCIGVLVVALALDVAAASLSWLDDPLETLAILAAALYGGGFALLACWRTFNGAHAGSHSAAGSGTAAGSSRSAKGKRTPRAMEDLLPDEPAKPIYFLDRGFPDLSETAHSSFRAVRNRVKRHFTDAADRLKASSDGLISRLVLSCLDLVAGIALALFGTVFVGAFALLHALVIAVIAAPPALAVAIIGGMELRRMRRDGIAGLCPVCKMAFELPGYRCPSCGAIHYRLRPGRYGILHHTCSCGQKLPCTRSGSDQRADGSPFKRADLEAVCTNPAAPHAIEGGESHAVCIPLAGGRSTGKTAFLNAVAYALTEEIAPGCGLSVTCLSGASAALHRTALSDYAAGEVSMTLESTDITAPTSTSLSFRLQGGSLEPDRIVHVIDTPGEAFIAHTEHERQLQYASAAGVVLMIDPMSIPAVEDARRRRLGMIDSAGIGNENPDRVLAALVAKMQDAAGVPADGKLRTPLAVVLGKIDQAGLASLFDDDAMRDLLAREASLRPEDAHDALCRAFFADNGMGNFLNTVAARFETARFFACSAIGHARGAGRYAPRGAIEPIAWILAQADPPLCRALGLDAASVAATT